MAFTRRQVLKIGGGIAAGGAFMSLPAFGQAATKWDLSDEYPITGFTGQVCAFFIDEMKKRVGDELEIIYHGSKELGFRSLDHFDAVQDGAVPIAITQTGQLGGVNPLFDLTALPFVVSSLDESRKLWEVTRPDFAKVFADANMVVLFAVPNAPNGIHAKFPIDSVDRLKGLRIRTYDAIGSKTFAEIGAAPLQIAFGDLVPQLSTGGVDAVLTSADGGVQLSIWDFLTDFTDLYYVMPLFMAHVNKDSYDALSDKARDAITEVTALTDDFAWSYVSGTLEKTFEILESHNYRINRNPPQEVLDTLRKAGSAAHEDWLSRMGPRGAEIMAAFDAAKKA